MNATNRTIATDNQLVPRLVFLHRAHSRLILVVNGLMSLDEAYGGLMVSTATCYRDRRPA